MNMDFSQFIKADIIREMKTWPYFEAQPDTAAQKTMWQIFNKQYRYTSEWLEFLELGRSELGLCLFSTEKILCKPYADRSLATLAFCKQIYLKIEFVQQIAKTHEALWGTCEYFEAQCRLHQAGYYGEPISASKRESFQSISGNINTYEKALKTNDLLKLRDDCPEPAKALRQKIINGEVDWRLHLTSCLIDEAIKHSIDNDDCDLKFHCRQYLAALRHFERLTSKGKNAGLYQIVFLPSLGSQLRFTGKGLKKIKPSTPKRKRGRPPKGRL